MGFILRYFSGVLLSLISGALFTANNFVINQFNVVVSDAVLVRCIIQIILYSFMIILSDDKILPVSAKQRLLTITQGKIIHICKPDFSSLLWI